jgi:hypothetical protein
MKEDTFTKSNETSKAASNGTQEKFKVQEDQRKLSHHIKRAEHFKTFVLVVITLVSFGLLIHQGIICISKYVNKNLLE